MAVAGEAARVFSAISLPSSRLTLLSTIGAFAEFALQIEGDAHRLGDV